MEHFNACCFGAHHIHIQAAAALERHFNGFDDADFFGGVQPETISHHVQNFANT